MRWKALFTGIIEEIGKIEKIHKSQNSAMLYIKAKRVLDDIKIGDSIAVNGVCLTVTTFNENGFVADVMHETLNRSSLGQLRCGMVVNLERAMAADGRFGGHMVSGHIDGMGKITKITKDGIALWYTIEASPNLMKYVVEKGSIAIDGISLTVASVEEEHFCVSTIPHTNEVTILHTKKVGDIVNLENDIVGKYVEKLLFGTKNAEMSQKKQDITEEFLKECGF